MCQLAQPRLSRTLNAIALHLVFPQKAAASFQNLQVVNNFLDRCFPMLYLSESRFQNWKRKWLLSAEGAVEADLARSYGVSQATISRLAAPSPFEASEAVAAE